MIKLESRIRIKNAITILNRLNFRFKCIQNNICSLITLI